MRRRLRADVFVGGAVLRRAAVVAAAIGATACGGGAPQPPPPPPPPPPHRVEADRPPARWASILPSGTEILFALGLGDSVVAVSEYCEHPPAARALPSVGSLAGLDLERLAALKAEALVYHPSQRELAAKARTMGLRTVELSSADSSRGDSSRGGVEELLASIRRLAEVAGVPARGEALADSLAAELAPVAREGPRPRVLLVTSREPGSFHGMYAAGPGSFYDDLIRRAGGENALSDAAASSVRLEAVDVVARKIDLVVELAGEGARARDPARAAAEWRRLGEYRVAVAAGDTPLIPGPRLPFFYRELAAWIAELR